MHAPTAPFARIRPATPDDAEALAAIYNHYVRHTTITFEETPVAGTEMARRMADVAAAGLPWLVACAGDPVVGYAYATPWKARSAYRHSVEVTVYLATEAGGRGIGTALYRELFDRLQAGGIHAAMGGVALPNAASIALHEKMGMRKVAHFAQVGFKFGRWVDVAYWQVLFPPAVGGETAGA